MDASRPRTLGPTSVVGRWAAIFAISSCTAGVRPAPPPPRPPLPRAPIVDEDPCEGFPTRVDSAPAPRSATVSLDILSGEARRLEENAKGGARIDLGTVEGPSVAVGRPRLSGPRLSPMDLSRVRFPVERANGLLPSSVVQALSQQASARGALIAIRQLRDPSKRAASCESRRTHALEVADRAVEDALAQREEAVADVLAAERALGRVDFDTEEGPARTDPALEMALTRAKRARDQTQPDELVGFFARYVLSDALLTASEPDRARAEIESLIGRTPPSEPWLRGEAELRAAELEHDEEKQHALYLAAASYARDNPQRRLAALAGAISTSVESKPEVALRLAGELAMGAWGDLGDAVDDYLGEVYAALLPERPRFWTLALPALSPPRVQRVARALAAEAERRGDRALARLLLTRAAELGADGPEGEALRRALANVVTSTNNVAAEARERIKRLGAECRGVAPGGRLSAKIRIELDAERRFSVAASKADEASAQCLKQWGPDFLLGLPPLRATLPR